MRGRAVEDAFDDLKLDEVVAAADTADLAVSRLCDEILETGNGSGRQSTRAIDALKEQGFWIAALDPNSDELLWQADLTGRIALVVGSEGKGIRRLVLEHCDHRLRIPLEGPITSLNASVSAGIALAECLRQRNK